MRIKEYFHQEKLSQIDKSIIQNIRDTLQALEWQKRHSSKDFRDTLLKSLGTFGWSNRVRIDQRSKINITSVLNDVGLCLQTGNMSRFYADLLKLETIYRKEIIQGAIYILPDKDWAKKLGANRANFERLVEELKIFEATVTIPIMIFGISGEK